MATSHYVTCPKCSKKFYLDRMLYTLVQANATQHMKGPFCKVTFTNEENVSKQH
jgi:hypothetical protein